MLHAVYKMVTVSRSYAGKSCLENETLTINILKKIGKS